MESGELRVKSGEWRVEGEEWRVESGTVVGVSFFSSENFIFHFPFSTFHLSVAAAATVTAVTAATVMTVTTAVMTAAAA